MKKLITTDESFFSGDIFGQLLVSPNLSHKLILPQQEEVYAFSHDVRIGSTTLEDLQQGMNVIVDVAVVDAVLVDDISVVQLAFEVLASSLF